MIRDLRVSDVPRQLLPGGLSGDDWAYTRATLSAGASPISQMALLRWSVSSSKMRRAVVSIQGGRMRTVALLRARRSIRAWEIAHLFTSQEGLDAAAELLDRCVTSVAQRGGERLFFRVLFRSPMQDIARRAGFMPAYTEEIFMLKRPLSAEVESPGLALRPVLPTDAHELFRLYNATAPATARSVMGLTMDQWSDAAEDPVGPAREFVWEEDGHIRGWLRQADRGKGMEVDALLHPDRGAQATDLTAAAARLARAHRYVIWAVPSYQPAISLALQRRGWQLSKTYVVMARSAAARVREPSLMPVQA